MGRFKKPLIIIFLLSGLLILVSALLLFLKSRKLISLPPLSKSESEIEKFSNQDEFKLYLAQAQSQAGDLSFGSREFAVSEAAGISQFGLSQPLKTGEGAPAERVSETNVQVVGIDEPDIVKTDGSTIFVSVEPSFFPEPLMDSPVGEIGILPPRSRNPETKLVKAYPASDLGIDSSIDKGGNLLLAGKILLVFSGNNISAYNVSDPKSPSKRWEFELDSRNSLVTSRLYKNKLFIVTQTGIIPERPCPIPMNSVGSLAIACSEIYHPVRPISVDTTYSALTINPDTGSVEGKVSFVGSSGTSVVYMSESSIYVTYSYNASIFNFLYGFYSEKGKDLVSQNTFSKLTQLGKYDISDLAKLTELQVLISDYENSLSVDEKKRVQNETNNRMQDYAKEHGRDLEKSGIVKISVPGLSITGTGVVPGRPLNQFSLDEYQANLRIATTVGAGWFSQETENDLYVLNSNLSVIGSVLGLGQGERIYSVRFVEGTGYLVTFRQTDPFFTLDLSNPAKPVLKGELKIPGYSSYLHPIAKDKILGVGKEDNQLKVSLFDVSELTNPTELSKYNLDEYWSEILNTHHAFLLDDKHQLFFLPGASGGYIFSYKDNSLSLVRVVSDITAKRAVYIGDFLYVISDEKIIVLDENDWSQVGVLSF